MATDTDEAKVESQGPKTTEEQPQSITGSGAPQVELRANVGILGLTVGQTGVFHKDDEIEALIASGLVAVVND